MLSAVMKTTRTGTRRHLALAGLCALVLAAAARAEPLVVTSLDEPVSLAGRWRFQPGDDPAWAVPGFDDTAWGELDVPGAWGRQGYDDVELAWYRRTVELPPAFAGRPGVVLGHHLPGGRHEVNEHLFVCRHLS